MYVNILNKKVAVCTLGCKVNQYESDSMMDILKKNGCEIVPFSQFADVYIVNTCSVTNMAERKSRQMLHRAKKKNPEAVIVAAGCYVQAAEEVLAKDLGIDILIGNNCKKDVARILSEYYEDTSMHEVVIDINHTNEYEEMTLVKPNERCRAYVKVHVLYHPIYTWQNPQPEACGCRAGGRRAGSRRRTGSRDYRNQFIFL